MGHFIATCGKVPLAEPFNLTDTFMPREEDFKKCVE